MAQAVPGTMTFGGITKSVILGDFTRQNEVLPNGVFVDYDVEAIIIRSDWETPPNIQDVVTVTSAVMGFNAKRFYISSFISDPHAITLRLKRK